MLRSSDTSFIESATIVTLNALKRASRQD